MPAGENPVVLLTVVTRAGGGKTQLASQLLVEPRLYIVIAFCDVLDSATEQESPQLDELDRVAQSLVRLLLQSPGGAAAVALLKQRISREVDCACMILSSFFRSHAL